MAADERRWARIGQDERAFSGVGATFRSPARASPFDKLRTSGKGRTAN